MIVVQLMGGLGNQMFQYAFAKCLALHKKTDLAVDRRLLRPDSLRSYSLLHFNIQFKFYKEYSLTDKVLLKHIFQSDFERRCVFYEEKNMGFNGQLFDLPGDNIYIRGFFQSEKYFQKYKDVIRNDFSITDGVSPATKEIRKRILSSNAIALHVRRGDYLTDSYAINMIGVCGMLYYEDAVRYIEERTSNPVFFIFSDDPFWVQENIKIDSSKYFVDINNADCGYQDLYLMSLCKHNIISNSTFSWWGAWLNSHNNKIVVAPNKWFRSEQLNSADIVPDAWIKL